MAMTQTDKDTHEMTRRITDISNSLKTLNALVAKLVGKNGEVSQKRHCIECNNDTKTTTIVEPCHDTNNVEH